MCNIKYIQSTPKTDSCTFAPLLCTPLQLTFLILDLGDEARVIELFQAFKFDVVIHFAAIAYVAESYKDPLMYYKNVSR